MKMPNLIADAGIAARLDELYRLEAAQQTDIAAWFRNRVAAQPDSNPGRQDGEFRRFFSDKLVALERAKAEFCFQVCRSLRARRLVEAGTSFGVSTLFLAAALRANLAEDGGAGMIFCAEHEPEKVRIARENFRLAGAADLIDLREGDLLSAFQDLSGPLDFVLMDVWGPVPAPLLQQLHERLRPGAVIIADNTLAARENYAEYLAYIGEPRNGYSTVTLPFEGGLEYTVRNR